MKSDKNPTVSEIQIVSSHFVFGAEKIGKNPDLALDSEGDGVLYKMHQLVVSGLDKLNSDGKNLAQRWQDRETKYGYEYFAFYQKDQNDKVISIISGVKQGDKMQILNTATLPEHRREGLMEDCFCRLVVHQDFPADIKNIEASLNTGVNKSPPETLTSDQEKKDYEAKQKQLITEINHHLKKFGFDVVFKQDSDQEGQNLSQDAQEVFNQIRSSVLWTKTNFMMMNKIFAGLNQEAIPTEMKFVIGEQTSNINLAPAVAANEILINYCQKMLAEKGIESSGLSASQATRLVVSKSIRPDL